jgi:hypothetical protein
MTVFVSVLLILFCLCLEIMLVFDFLSDATLLFGFCIVCGIGDFHAALRCGTRKSIVGAGVTAQISLDGTIFCCSSIGISNTLL